MEVPQLLAIGEVAKALTISTSTLKRLIREGEFPEPIHPTEGASAWLAEDVAAYLHRRMNGHRYRKAGSKEGKAGDPLDEI